MSEFKHTPGPWLYIHADGFTVRHPQIYSDIGPVCNATWLGENKMEELRANAKLIAAAPDLLEALCGLVGCIDHGSDNPEQKLKKARAAIAKATPQHGPVE